MSKIIVIPKSKLGAVTSIDEGGKETRRNAVIADDGGLIDMVSSIQVGEPEEETGANPRVAVAAPFSPEALAALKSRVATAQVLDTLPANWRRRNV
jgi:hypothetical protein